MASVEEQHKKVSEWQKARLDKSVFLIAKYMTNMLDCGGSFSQMSEALFKVFSGYLAENCVKVKSFEGEEEIYDEVSYYFMQLADSLFKVMREVQTIDAICEQATGKNPVTWFDEMEKELDCQVEEMHDVMRC